MNKKNIIAASFIFLLISAGFIAVTQEAEHGVPAENAVLPEFFPDAEDNEFKNGGAAEEISKDKETEYIPPYRGYIYAKAAPEWIRPARWFRSNAGGVAIEETPSRLAALRNEYALSVNFSEKEELPNAILPFYNDDRDYIEVRALYENRNQIRTQWIFRNFSGSISLIAVFSGIDDRNNFIEIYGSSGLVQTEYGYSEGAQKRSDYFYNNGLLTAINVYIENNLSYIDSFLYNRASFLRAIERKYYEEGKLSFSLEPVRVTLPKNSKEALSEKYFAGARYNTLPGFFGAAFFDKDYKMIYALDDKNRILSQTLFDSEENVLYVITNIWQGGRITSSTKKEGDNELTVRYEYDSAGNRIREANYANGVLERVVRTESKTEIEELYIDGEVVLRAVWEDGIKIQETRIRKN